MLAVDAGTHLSAITRILENDFPTVAQKAETDNKVSEGVELAHSPADSQTPNSCLDSGADSPGFSRTDDPAFTVTTLNEGPFAGLAFPYQTASANAAYFVREHVSTYLITHPHLDHLSGFAINTAAFHNTSRPKRLAALPFTVNAIKTHIFNDLIWPNLTDEDGGVGFVTFQRLAEGGNIALGDGHSRGFIEVCEGLSVRAFKVSHGKCTRGAPVPPIHPHRRSSGANVPDAAGATGHGHSHGHGHGHGHSHSHSHSQTVTFNGVREGGASGFGTPRDPNRRGSLYSQTSQPGTPTWPPVEASPSTVDSSAFFIRTEASVPLSSSTNNFGSSTSSWGPSHTTTTYANRSTEVLIFGDVEPDAISAVPRTQLVWNEAAPKIAAGILKGIFIECSYTDAQADAVLFGHLAPRHVIAELAALAETVEQERKDLQHQREEREKERAARKRKRQSTGLEASEVPIGNGLSTLEQHAGNKRRTPQPLSHTNTDTFMSEVSSEMSSPAQIMSRAPTELSSNGPPQRPGVLSNHGEAGAHDGAAGAAGEQLKGLKVVIIHVKDALSDGPPIGDVILSELKAHEERLVAQGKGLGCEFVISKSGTSYWF